MSTIRLLTLAVAIVLGFSASAAEQLYRWREADGSVTFSHTPPAKGSGIAFEKVSSNQGITLARSDRASASSQSANTASRTAPATVEHLIPAASRRKSVQCGELQKRVLSLERLLRTDISAETMDNAIVQMSRYQHSFNQACNR